MHAEQMTESLTTPDPLHTEHVSSVTPILLAPHCAAARLLPTSCRPPADLSSVRSMRHLAAKHITRRASVSPSRGEG
jgi:hypothetical protein